MWRVGKRLREIDGVMCKGFCVLGRDWISLWTVGIDFQTNHPILCVSLNEILTVLSQYIDSLSMTQFSQLGLSSIPILNFHLSELDVHLIYCILVLTEWTENHFIVFLVKRGFPHAQPPVQVGGLQKSQYYSCVSFFSRKWSCFKVTIF